MVEDETKKHHWLRIASIAIITFIVAFLAFYVAMELMLHRMSDPMYNAKRIEKMMREQEKSFEKFEDKMTGNIFEATVRPTVIDLIKEENTYKVVVNLKIFDGNENSINVETDNNELTVSGELDKKIRGKEKMISFKQSYYLDENLDSSQITKERIGDKYIITIPFRKTN